MEFKEAEPEVVKGARMGKSIVPGHTRWKMCKERALKTMCVNWNPNGDGCKLYGAQARCLNCKNYAPSSRTTVLKGGLTLKGV